MLAHAISKKSMRYFFAYLTSYSVSLTETYFHFSLMWSLLPNDLTNQNLFILTAVGVMPCGGCGTSLLTSL